MIVTVVCGRRASSAALIPDTRCLGEGHQPVKCDEEAVVAPVGWRCLAAPGAVQQGHRHRTGCEREDRPRVSEPARPARCAWVTDRGPTDHWRLTSPRYKADRAVVALHGLRIGETGLALTERVLQAYTEPVA